MLRNSKISASLRPRRRSVLTARLRAESARTSGERGGIPVALIRGGTRRGAFVLRKQPPSHPMESEGDGAPLTEPVFDEVGLMRASIPARRECRPPKVCLIAPAAGRGGRVRVRILYPDGRGSHPGFAVTGALTLAVGCCLKGSRLAPCRGAHHLNIEHPGGTLAVRWTPGVGELPATVARWRDVRQLLRGAAS